jgi:NAD(P) transhydrogenase
VSEAAQEFDLIVIGSGPAGEKGAAQAAYFGKRVALVEKHSLLGGALINTGTIPSKTLRETALYFSGRDQRGLYGIDYTLRENLTVPEFMRREVDVTSSASPAATGRKAVSKRCSPENSARAIH